MPGLAAASKATHVLWMSKFWRSTPWVNTTSAHPDKGEEQSVGKSTQPSSSLLPELAGGRNGPKSAPQERRRSPRQAEEQSRSSRSKEAPSPAPDSGAEFPTGVPMHTLSMEAGGLTLEDLKREMVSDSKVQDEALPLLYEILEATIERNDSLRTTRSQDMLVFEGNPAPLPIREYVKRILKYGATTTSLIIGLMYLDRLKTRRRNLRLTSTNYQRLLLVAVMEASKYIDDDYHTNARWSEIGNVCLYELNHLELKFIFALEFDMGVQTEEYKLFLRKLICICTEEPAAPEPAAAAPWAVIEREGSFTGSTKSLTDVLSESGTVEGSRHAGRSSPLASSSSRECSQKSGRHGSRAIMPRPNPWEVETTGPEVLRVLGTIASE